MQILVTEGTSTQYTNVPNESLITCSVATCRSKQVLCVNVQNGTERDKDITRFRKVWRCWQTMSCTGTQYRYPFSTIAQINPH